MPDPASSCSTTTDSVICTDVGLFPDPNDCTRYYKCDSSLTATIETCPTGFVYYSVGQLCRKREQNNCQTLKSCLKTSNTGKLVRFSDDAAIFAYCGDNALPTMFRCTDRKNEIFDERLGFCRYNCRRDGLFVDRTNCEGYILCRKLNNQWRPQAWNCPTDYWFNQTRCEVQSDTKCVSEITTKKSE